MFKVKVPSTTANLGPGYDVLGMSLKMYSVFEVEKSDKIEVVVNGVEKEKIGLEKNLVTVSMDKVFDYVGKRPEGYKLTIENGIPMARGLGSSAAAIIGGLKCANALLDFPLDDNKLLDLATEIEGHPDNVAPALLGGLIASTTKSSGRVVYKRIEPFKNLSTVVFVPEYEVSTKASREVVPTSLPIKDAVHNMSNVALMLVGFMTGDIDLISDTMDDCLHEPYRKVLIKGFDDFKREALAQGAFSFSLSGSGSTVIAYALEENVQKVAEAFEELAKKLDIAGEVKILAPCDSGATSLS